MKRNLLFLVLFASFISFQAISQHNFGDNRVVRTENSVTAPKVNSINVDGILDDADWSINQAVSRVISGTPGIDSNEVHFGVAYNAEYLYIGLDVKDTIITFFEMGEVFVDGNNNDGAYDNGDLHIRFAGPFVEVIYPDTIIGILLQFTFKPTLDGFTAELGIPWSELGITPVAGEQIGFDIIMGDGDSGTGVDYLMSWNGDLMNYVETSNFGDLIFGESSSVGGIDVYSDQIELYPNPTSGNINLKVVSDSFRGPAAINVSDVTGREVYQGQCNFDSDKLVRMDASLFIPGVYFVNITSQDGLRAVKKLIVR